jgi:signal peptidase I
MESLTEILLWPFTRLNQLFSGHGKMRSNADNWLDLAEKVRCYRSDRFTPAEAAELAARQADLRRGLREKADAGKLKLSIEALEDVLRRVGGSIYPKTALSENVDFFLVAAIVILGIRTYFVQPFKIPTNSMWPTYYGMTAENIPPGAPAPGLPERLWRFAAFGAQRREMIAPRSGQVSAPYILNGNALLEPHTLAYRVKTGRKWLVIPTQVREYTFYVDGVPTAVQVPEDFDGFDAMATETFFGDDAGFVKHLADVGKAGPLEASLFKVNEEPNGYQRVVTIPLGRTVRAGEPVLRFDVMTGDQLFVDRISYHFFRPKVGQGFVFRTGSIPAIGKDDYFIKHLVGVPGDVMEIRPPVLYRNGAPITGAEAFQLNAQRVPPYTGYTYANPAGGGTYLFKGQTLTVPPGTYFAMGDNSSNSFDGRYWGFVPAADVIGRPLFVYYPFTHRWGPAR